MPRLWPDRRVKPQYGTVEIDWGHKLASGLDACWLFNEGGGTILDLTKRGADATLSGGLNWVTGQGGIGIDSPHSDTVQATFSTRGLPTSTNTLTMMAIFTMRTLNPFNVLYETRSLVLQGLLLSSATGNPLTWAWNADGNDYGAATGLTLSTGRVYLGVAAIAAGTTKMYLVDLSNLGTMSTFNSGLSNTAQTMNGSWQFCVDSNGGSRGWDGHIYQAAMWERTLSDADVQTLAAEPYAFLREARRRRIFVVAGVPPADTVLDTKHRSTIWYGGLRG